MFNKSLKEQMQDNCRYFTGMMSNDKCEVGIDYMSMRIISPGGGMATFPCYRNNLNGKCSKFNAYTEHEIQSRIDEIKKSHESTNDLQARKSDVCIHCGKQVKSMRQIGHCVYAEPCQCRLWQGIIPLVIYDKHREMDTMVWLKPEDLYLSAPQTNHEFVDKIVAMIIGAVWSE